MTDKQNPLVSVVIPCYNRAQFLEPTIQSALQQDYKNIEIIVIDGGSTDGTLDILHKYDGKIDWISEPDKGHADAINKGWARSHGDILTWLNADDLWKVPHAAGLAAAFLKEHPDVSVVYGDCERIDTNGNVVGMCYRHEWTLKWAVEHCDHCIPQPASFIRRDVLEKVGWLDSTLMIQIDRELWLRIGLVGKFQYYPAVLAQARNIEGISYTGDKAALSCVQLIEKFFSLPDIPGEIIRLKKRAMSNTYLVGISYAFAGGRHWGLIWSFLLKALKSDPSNIFHAVKYLILVPVGLFQTKSSESRKSAKIEKGDKR